MALADLMKKGFLTSATATPAAPAAHIYKYSSTVATVAGVAVANFPNAKSIFMPASANDSADAHKKSTQQTQQHHAKALALFHIDSVREEANAGPYKHELQRINNMAHEFMLGDGLAFTDAVKLAAEIARTCPIAECEGSYVDVAALRLNRKPHEVFKARESEY